MLEQVKKLKRIKVPVWERLAAKITFEDRGYLVDGKPSDCWVWNGYKSKDDYGQIKWNGQACWVHRVMYILLFGPIGKDENGEPLEFDHLCKYRDCCNPDHGEIVTAYENKQRRIYGHRKAA